MAEEHEDPGALSPAEERGTPVPVDLSEDRATRWVWAMFVGGPVIWFSHFMLVYLVAEAGCTGGGMGLELLDPPVPVVTTLATSVVALVACVAVAVWAYRHWRDATTEIEHTENRVGTAAGEYDADHRRGTLGLTGFLLALLSFVAVVFTAVTALVLGPC